MPSIGELMKMYSNLLTAGVGGFASASYWSSSEVNATGAWNQFFTNGSQGNVRKATLYRVRPVRGF